jgi:hypothetical protein
VAGVATFVGLLLLLNGRPAAGPAPGTVAAGAAAGAGPSAAGPARSPAGTASTDSGKPATPSPAAALPSQTARAVAPGRAAAPSAPTQVVEIPVLVLNNSRIYHLARRVAAELTAAGWPVAGIGNFTGRLPATTAFYAPGAQDSARLLARRFPGVTVLQPRPSWLPGDAALTLVVTRYWP